MIYGKDSIPQAIERQAVAAVEEADVLVMVVDGQEGLTGADAEIAQWLRRHHSSKPVVLAVNKCENVQKAELQAAMFWELGMEPLAVSAISGFGTGDLLDQILKQMPVSWAFSLVMPHWRLSCRSPAQGTAPSAPWLAPLAAPRVHTRAAEGTAG